MKKVFCLVLLCSFIINSYAHGEDKINFVENRGQWDHDINYMAKIGGGNVWLKKNSFTFSFIHQEDFEKLHQMHHGKYKPSLTEKFRQHAYTLNFINSNPEVKLSSSQAFDFYHNYYIGNDPGKWASQVKIFGQINYSDLYAGIDVRLETSHDGYLKYDFIVHPGSDASQIKWSYDGISPQLKNNEIILNSNAGKIIEKLPEVYQIINGEKKLVVCNLVLKNKIISFDFPNGYDKNHDLIIDPTLIFSTYTGSTADNWGYTATYDSQGNAYGGGVVFSSGFPVSPGAFDNSFSGGGTVTDIGLIKYSANGMNRLFATYLGGTGSESPHSLIVDSQDNIILYGTTSSSNFPVSAGCYDNSFNGGSNVTMDGYISYSAGVDIFVTKLDAAGTTLMGSTFVGGTSNEGLNNATTLYYNYGDEARGEVIVDDNDNIIVASCTQSSNFPTTAGSLSQTLQGTQDGVVFQLNNTCSNLNWSTYLGGSTTDAAYGVKVNPINGNIYVCGGTKSSNFPTLSGTIHPAQMGGTADGFVVSLNPSDAALITGTYLGTAGYDQSYAIQIDSDGDIYLMGQSTGGYPVVGSVYSNANSSQFVHKLNPDFTTTLWSTVIGSGTSATVNISPVAFLVDYCKNIYISGWGGTINAGYGNGNTNGMPVTAGAYDVTTDGSDFYCMVLERNAASLLYGTFFGGGGGGEHVDGGTSRFDESGTIYQAVCAGCGGSSSFPTTPGAWSTVNSSSNCNLGLFKMEFNYNGVQADATAAPNIIACDPPYDVNFTGSNNPDHIWDFGDGSPTDTSQNPSHTYTAIGSYTVMYIAIDSSSCNIADTAYLSVEILQSEVFSATLDVGPYDPCTGGPYDVMLEFTGTGADSLVWDMGDGNTYNDTIVNHAYVNDGQYIITLTAYDFTCGLVETITDTVEFNSNNTTANASAAPNVIACDPPFVVNYTGGSTPNHYWDFGDGVGTSTLQNPSYTFTAIGNYTVMYVGIDSSTCNIADTVYLTVEVLEAEDFSAEFTPIPPQNCSDSVFVNVAFTGSGADALTWDMGDGNIFLNDTFINYVYTIPGTYTMSLTAYDSTCNKTETISQTIIVEDNVIDGTVFVPNVFSPNNDALNEKFRVGYSNYPSINPMEFMEEYHVEIYNRWGKLVFESTDAIKEWDGKIKGDPASEGVYYYILTYKRICLDEVSTTTHGYVTLLRD